MYQTERDRLIPDEELGFYPTFKSTVVALHSLDIFRSHHVLTKEVTFWF